MTNEQIQRTAEKMDAAGSRQINEDARRARLLKPLMDELYAANKHLKAIAGWIGCLGWLLIISFIGGAALTLLGLSNLL